MTDAIHETMQAWRIDRFGGPEVLREVTLPVPHPARGEVLVEVRSAGVNPVDLKTREGRYALIREDALPFTPGRDAAGIVARCGASRRRSMRRSTARARRATPRGRTASNWPASRS